VTAESERRNIPITQKALPRWITTERCWNINTVERSLWVTVASRRSIPMTRWKTCLPQVPDVSIATAMDEIDAVCYVSVLLRFHRFCCCCRGNNTCTAGQNVRHGERVWASRIPCYRQRPRDQGTCVTPSGNYHHYYYHCVIIGTSSPMGEKRFKTTSIHVSPSVINKLCWQGPEWAAETNKNCSTEHAKTWIHWARKEDRRCKERLNQNQIGLLVQKFQFRVGKW